MSNGLRQLSRENLSRSKLQTIIHDQNKNASANHLDKYRIIKLLSSGDYQCNDQFGNTYLLVCQLEQGGFYQFKNYVRNNFQRNAYNRALIIPFQDIKHDGVTFTVYMLPQRSQCLREAFSSKVKSEIFCLSLLYTLIKKVIRPMIEIFGYNADKWLHVQNIWIKQSTMFYVLNQRKKQNYSIKKTQQKRTQSNYKSVDLDNQQRQQYQKHILRRLCIIMVPFFKIDQEIKSFLSIIIDAMLNQQFTIQQVCILLSDKRKRKSFMDEKSELFVTLQQKNQNGDINSYKNQLWGRKRSYYVDYGNNRRGLKNQTLNIQLTQKQQRQQFYAKNIRNGGQTLNVPPSFKQRKRSSLSITGLFSFKDSKKKRSSVSSQKSKSRYQDKQKGVSKGIQQTMKKALKTFLIPTNNSYSFDIELRQKAYMKFKETIEKSDLQDPITKRNSIHQQQKHLKAYLQYKSKQKNRKFSTIDVSQLKNYTLVPNKKISQTIDHQIQIQKNDLQIRKNLFLTSQNRFDTIISSNDKTIINDNKDKQKVTLSSQQKQKNKTQLQKQKQKQKQKERQKIRQGQIQREMERLKKIQEQKQRQIERLKQKERQREKSRQRQRQRIKQKQKQLYRQIQKQKQKIKQQQQKIKNQQKQKQKQINEKLKKQLSDIQKEKAKLKQIEKYTQKQRQRQRQRQRQIQTLRQKQKRQKQIEKQIIQRQLQKQKQLKKQGEMKRNQSAQQVKTKNIIKNSYQPNLDQIQIIQPIKKSQLDAKKQKQKKELQQRQKKQNMPPRPSNANKTSQGLRKKDSLDSVQQIVLQNKPGKQQKQQQKKQVKKPPAQIKQAQVKRPQPSPPPKQIKKQKVQEQSGSRTKTVTSQIPSSCGPKKPVSKQVAEYMHMINKIGEGVAKSSKLSAKLQGVQWFTGVYFVYKRFLFERKRIQRWLNKKQPFLTRYQQKNNQQWEQWFKTDEKKTLQQKIKAQNENILASLIKMNKKLLKKNLNANIVHHAAINKQQEQQSKILVSEVIKQYDDLDEKQKLKDQEVLTHVNQMLNSLYIIAELDGKIKQKKPLIQILKIKNEEELSEFSDYIYELYIKQ